MYGPIQRSGEGMKGNLGVRTHMKHMAMAQTVALGMAHGAAASQSSRLRNMETHTARYRKIEVLRPSRPYAHLR